MKKLLRGMANAVALGICSLGSSMAADLIPGADLAQLLDLARSSNPEYASMRFEAQATAERVAPAGALPDPKFRFELMDITRMGEQNPALLPGNAGSTRYTLMQDLPWFGKRDLRRDIAQFDADSSQGRVKGNWVELATKIKTIQAQRRYLRANEKLTQEILDLIVRLEQVVQIRYAGGLTAQQDVIRTQVEQTSMRNELVGIDSERQQADARLNSLLARPTGAPLAAPDAARPLPAPSQLLLATLEERVRQRNPQLLTEDSRIKAAEKSRDLTYKNRYPDFTLAITPTQTNSWINEWSLMVEVNIPLQQSSRRAMERESEAMLEAARARKEALFNQVLAELAQHLAALDAARRMEALATGSLSPQADLTFKSALASYENGKLDFATLLEAQRQVRQAKQSQIKAQLEAHMRLAEIEKILGEDL